MNITVENFENPIVKTWWKTEFESGYLITNTIFQSWEWNYYWWKVFGAKDNAKNIFILVLWDNESIKAIAPFLIQRRSLSGKSLWKKVLWIATDYSDYPDLISSNEQVQEKWNAIIQFVQSHQPDSWFELWDILPGGSLSKSNCGNDSVEYIKTEGSLFLNKKLPNNLNELSDQFGKNFIKKINQIERQLKRNGSLSYQIEWKSSQISSKKLRILNLQKFAQRSFFANSDNSIFFESLVNDEYFSKKCFFSNLLLNDVIVSVLMGFHHNNTLYYYLSGYDENYSAMSPSTLNIYVLMREAIQNGYCTFDFLRGKESYKYRWGVKEIKSYHYAIVPKDSMMKYRIVENLRKSKKRLWLEN